MLEWQAPQPSSATPLGCAEGKSADKDQVDELCCLCHMLHKAEVRNKLVGKNAVGAGRTPAFKKVVLLMQRIWFAALEGL